MLDPSIPTLLLLVSIALVTSNPVPDNTALPLTDSSASQSSPTSSTSSFASVCLNVSLPQSKPCPCSSPPSWNFYDIVDHLTSINISATESTEHLSDVPKGSPTGTGIGDPQTRVTSHNSDPNIQFHYSLRTNQLENISVSKPVEAFERSELGDLRNNVTLVVGINLNEHRLHSDQQIFNLEQIYKSLQEVSLKNVRFILVNSRKSINPSWVYELRQRVSFEVFQELPSSPLIGTLLPGNTGDIFIFDR